MPIFKYFTHEAHALALIRKGELMLQALSHFREVEDGGVRGDRDDGVLIYAHDALTIKMQDGREIPVSSFNSTVRQNGIYVYCASMELSAERAEEFGSFCVEITDPDALVRRLRARAHVGSQLDYEQIVSGQVDYRVRDREPGVEWALPEKLVLMKPPDFARQAEYRFAVGRRNALDVENVDLTIELAPSAERPEAAAVAPRPIFLRLGRMNEVARLHRF